MEHIEKCEVHGHTYEHISRELRRHAQKYKGVFHLEDTAKSIL